MVEPLTLMMAISWVVALGLLNVKANLMPPRVTSSEIWCEGGLLLSRADGTPPYSPPRSYYPASPLSQSSTSSELEYLAEQALHAKNAVFAEIARLRLENSMLRAEDSRLTELRRSLLGIPQFSFTNRGTGWSLYEASMNCFRGQLGPTGSADGWAMHGNGDVIVGEFTSGAVNGVALCTTTHGEALLSRFHASRPVGTGVAWGSDRSHSKCQRELQPARPSPEASMPPLQ